MKMGGSMVLAQQPVSKATSFLRAHTCSYLLGCILEASVMINNGQQSTSPVLFLVAQELTALEMLKSAVGYVIILRLTVS